MATITFVRKLREAGFDEKQAEGIAEAFNDASGEAELCTKRDLEMLKLDIRVDFERIERKQLEQDGEFKVLKWMLGVIAGGIVALLLKSFFPA
jgi:hypothetical protein